MTDALRPLVTCLGEDRPEWHTKMHNVVLSLRRFGGASADVPAVVHVVGSVDPAFARRMADLNAEVRVVAPMEARLPTSNKLRMLELERDDVDVLVMLDCDILVHGDFGPELDAERVRMAVAGRAHVSDSAWTRLYETFGLPAPTERVVTSVVGEKAFPYWNSGVMFVPRQHCQPLRATWGDFIPRYLDLAAGDAAIGAFRPKDQVPLSLALAATGIDVRPLGGHLNLTTTQVSRRPSGGGRWGPPFLLHYHRSIDADGFVTASPDPEINELIDAFNRCRAAELGLAYDGLVELDRAAVLRRRLKTHPLFWRAKRRLKPVQRAMRRRRRSG